MFLKDEKKVERKERSEWEEKKKMVDFHRPRLDPPVLLISAGAFYFNAVVSPTDPQVHLAGIVTN